MVEALSEPREGRCDLLGVADVGSGQNGPPVGAVTYAAADARPGSSPGPTCSHGCAASWPTPTARRTSSASRAGDHLIDTANRYTDGASARIVGDLLGGGDSDHLVARPSHGYQRPLEPETPPGTTASAWSGQLMPSS